MASNDMGSGRTSPYPSRNGTSSPPLPSTSLSHAHIVEALQNSPDSGATLDLTHGNLTDVGELGAEELATIGREDNVEDESSVLRCASIGPSNVVVVISDCTKQNCTGV